jgi:hypothetical protein
MLHTSFYRSSCVAMDGRSDSDIPAFGCTPQYQCDLNSLTLNKQPNNSRAPEDSEMQKLKAFSDILS